MKPKWFTGAGNLLAALSSLSSTQANPRTPAHRHPPPPKHHRARTFSFRRRRVTRVDFVVAGVQKSGTTALYYFLSKHPQVALLRTKRSIFSTTKRTSSTGRTTIFCTTTSRLPAAGRSPVKPRPITFIGRRRWSGSRATTPR